MLRKLIDLVFIMTLTFVVGRCNILPIIISIFIVEYFFLRVTQVYDVGACVYFYFGFNYRCIPPLKSESEAEAEVEPSLVRGLHVYEEVEVYH